jgi:hypothetical protein
MHNQLNLVPNFLITDVQRAETLLCTGTFDTAVHLNAGWPAFLVSDNDCCIEGNILAVEPDFMKAIFQPKNTEHAGLFAIGRSFAYLDGYWGERVELVLDSTRQWKEMFFEPADAREFISKDSRILGKADHATGASNEDSRKPIKGGWDHEHCAMCWETISKQTQSHGYVTQDGILVCDRCYGSYIKHKSLSFLDEQAISQIRGVFK